MNLCMVCVIYMSQKTYYFGSCFGAVCFSLKDNMVASILDIFLKIILRLIFFQVKTKIRDNMIIYLFIYYLLSYVQSDAWKTSATPTQVFDLINFPTNTLLQQIHLVCSYCCCFFI